MIRLNIFSASCAIFSFLFQLGTYSIFYIIQEKYGSHARDTKKNFI